MLRYLAWESPLPTVDPQQLVREEIKRLKESKWLTYKDEKFGFQFKYPESWGLPQVEEVTSDWFLPSKEELQPCLDKNDQKNLNQVVKSYRSITFANPQKCPGNWCGVGFSVYPYTPNSRYVFYGYEGFCSLADILSLPKARLRDSFFKPGRNYQRFYEVVSPKFYLKFEAGYDGYDSEDELTQEVFWEDLIKNHPNDLQTFGFEKFTQDLAKVIDSVKVDEQFE